MDCSTQEGQKKINSLQMEAGFLTSAAKFFFTLKAVRQNIFSTVDINLEIFENTKNAGYLEGKWHFNRRKEFVRNGLL
jgi:hypothetical protein